MTISETYSYRHAEAILKDSFPDERTDILDALAEAPWSSKNVLRARTGRTLDLDQKGTNRSVETAFKARNWIVRPRIVSHSDSQLVSDFKKSRVQVEVQFGNMARWYTDVFKFLLSYSADDIEVGVLVVPMKTVAERIDENVAHFERIVRELPHARMGITLPIWVIGVS